MKHQRRFQLPVIALLAILTVLASKSRAIEPVENNAAESKALKYLPSDYWAVVEADISIIMKGVNAPGADKNPKYAEFKQAMQMAKMMTGVDLEHDVARATLFAAGPPGDHTQALVVVQGSFDNDEVQKHLAALGENTVAKSEYKNQTTYAFQKMKFYFPETSMIVIGHSELVHQAIDSIAAGEKKLPESLSNVLKRTPASSAVWSAVKPGVLLEKASDWKTANPESFEQLSKVECLSMYYALSGDGLLVNGLGFVPQPGGGEKLHHYLRDRKSDLLHKEGANVVFTTLLILSDVTSDGQYVEASLRLTGAVMKELWETKVIVPQK